MAQTNKQSHLLRTPVSEKEKKQKFVLVDLDEGEFPTEVVPGAEDVKAKENAALDQKEDRKKVVQLAPHKSPGMKNTLVEISQSAQMVYSALQAPPGMRTFARGMFKAGLVYTFRCKVSAGVLAGSSPFPEYVSVSSSPAGGITDAAGNNTPVSEWSTLTSLFDEYRVPRMSAIIFLPTLSSDVGSNAQTLAVFANSYSNEFTAALSTTALTRFNALRQVAESHPVQCPMANTNPWTVPIRSSIKWRFPTTGIPQAWDSCPSPATNPYGSIEYARNHVTTSSQGFGHIWVTYEIQFRNRQ